nr:exosome complex component RRP41 homolog [Quercus suber]
MRQIRAVIGAVPVNSKFQIHDARHSDYLTIHRDISSYSPDYGSLHIDTLDASVSGTRSACINAATLALADAGIPMRDLVTSCSSGYLNFTLLDLNYVEDSAGGPDLNVGFLPKLDKFTVLQMDSKLPIDIFENVMQLAIEGCKAVANYIREVKNTKQLDYRRGM